MGNVSGRAARVVSSEQLEYEYALKRRALWRVVTGSGLAFLALLIMAFAAYPIVLKSTLPLLWLQEANAGGWNKELQTIGINLLAKGRIEVFPLWISIAAGAASCLLAWVGATLIRLKDETSPWAVIFSKSFWCQVYLWKQPDHNLRVTSRRPPQAKG